MNNFLNGNQVAEDAEDTGEAEDTGVAPDTGDTMAAGEEAEEEDQEPSRST